MLFTCGSIKYYKYYMNEKLGSFVSQCRRTCCSSVWLCSTSMPCTVVCFLLLRHPCWTETWVFKRTWRTSLIPIRIQFTQAGDYYRTGVGRRGRVGEGTRRGSRTLCFIEFPCSCRTCFKRFLYTVQWCIDETASAVMFAIRYLETYNDLRGHLLIRDRKVPSECLHFYRAKGNHIFFICVLQWQESTKANCSICIFFLFLLNFFNRILLIIITIISFIYF